MQRVGRTLFVPPQRLRVVTIAVAIAVVGATVVIETYYVA